MTIGVAEARERVRIYLQDSEYVRWGKHEINQYLHEAAEDFVSRVGYPIVSSSSQTSASSALTLSSDPEFDVGETITGNVTGSTGKILTSGTETTFDTFTGPGFSIGETVTGGTSANSSVITGTAYNFLLSLPADISNLTYVEVDGLEVPVVTESEMRHYAVAGSLDEVESSQDKTTKIFGAATTTTVKWREKTGKCKAIVLTSATSDFFRIYPIPSEIQKMTLYGVYRPLHASDIIPYQFSKSNINTPVSLKDNTTYSSSSTATNVMVDTSNNQYTLNESDQTLTELKSNTDGSTSAGSSYPLRSLADYRLEYEVDRKFMNILMYGALERAYLKEHDLRNTEKSEYYRQKKEAMTQEAVREDALNPASISGGINFNRLTSSRKWQYQFS